MCISPQKKTSYPFAWYRDSCTSDSDDTDNSRTSLAASQSLGLKGEASACVLLEMPDQVVRTSRSTTGGPTGGSIRSPRLHGAP